mgnify:CR=1 FL=1
MGLPTQGHGYVIAQKASCVYYHAVMRQAYSYVRFSSFAQNLSDSKRRQIAVTQKWCRENNYSYNEAGEDLGVSGSTGANQKETSALGKFIAAVDSGKIKTPCVLVLESLDRLTRRNLRAARNLCEDLIGKGVSIANVEDNKIYDEKSLNDPFDLISLIMRLDAGHKYQKSLGKRSQKSWQWKQKNMSPKNILTTAIPSWLEIKGERKTVGKKVISDNRKIVVNKKHADIVKRIYKEYLEGVGTGSIAIKLNQDKIPTPSQWTKNKFTQKTRIKNNVGLLWSERIVRRFLTHHAVYGTHLITKKIEGKRIKEGEPVDDYYPPILSRKTFYKVQDEIKRRNKMRGPNTGRKNLFSGIVFCMKCGFSMLYSAGDKKFDKDTGKQKFQYLKCKASAKGGDCVGPKKPFKYQRFEDAVISSLHIHILNQIYQPNSSKNFQKLVDDLKQAREEYDVQQESMKEHREQKIKFPTYLSKVVTELEEKIESLEATIAETPTGTDNLFEMADAINQLESGEKEPLEKNNLNRAKISGIIRDYVQRIEIDPLTNKVAIITKFVSKVNKRLAKGNIKNYHIQKWLDLNKVNDDYEDGGYSETSTFDPQYKQFKVPPKENAFGEAEFLDWMVWR